MIQLEIIGLRKLKRANKILALIENRPWIVFVALLVVILFLFRGLFNSYFEADEWFHFTYYFPLTKRPDGFLTAIISTIINSGPLSAGQHVVPVASAIYFLNTKFFGMNYAPYAFMSLSLHAVNSFLVFVFIKTLLHRKDIITKNVFALLGAVFFALSPQHSHTITGAAPFYGQNILSVTFFLLCIISFKLAYLRENKKFIYLSILFLFLSLFTKETAVFLFVLLPFMAIIEKKGLPASRPRTALVQGRQVFPLKFLGKLFILSLIIYATFRFLVPNIYYGVGPLVDKLVGNYVSSSLPSWQQQSRETPKVPDTGTIVSTDLSIHKNLLGEILFRSVTFPVKMTGTLFLPRQTVFSIVQFITPIVQPVPPGGDSADMSQARLTFLYGPGNGFIIYIVGIGIIIFCAREYFSFVRGKKIEEARTLATGFAMIVLSSLPLVAIIFSFPRWGYDFYFDSRFYYNPNVGAAIIFPFLLLGFSEFISKSFQKKTVVPLIAFTLFTLWLINNIAVLNVSIRYFTQNFQPDRREVVEQLKKYLPSLPKITVFYIETDGLSAYGPSLPFQTGVAPALSVVYYDNNPLPNSFFNKPLFDGKKEGYLYSQGRGFGYYISKKTLAEALLASKFKVSDIRAFYYKAQDVKLIDTTGEVRAEMDSYLTAAKENSDWKNYLDLSTGLSFYYPSQADIEEVPQDSAQSTATSFAIISPIFTIRMTIFNVTPAFAVNEYSQILTNGKLGIVNSRKVSYDKFHYNDSLIVNNNGKIEYLIKLNDRLIIVETENQDAESILAVEKIAGSVEIIKKE